MRVCVAPLHHRAYAMVSSSGEIFLSRPGTLEVMCKFSGLVAFPFDKLICNVEFGGWGWSGGQQGLELRGPGYQFSAQEATAGSTYQEYKIINISVARENYFYDCCPSEPWPVVTYEIKLDRSSNFYVFTLLVPTCIITCLSFVVFWAPPSAADALSFGITIIVVVILMNVVLLELLPICGELLWIDLFMFVNTLFCMLSLFQSALTILIEQTTSEFIMPTWLVLPAMLLWKKMFPKGLCISAKKRKQIYAEEALFKDDMASSEASIQLAKSLDVKESIAGVMYRQHGPGGRTARVESITRPELTERDMERLCYFEKLFFRMDEDHNGAISMDECTLFLSFVCLDLDVAERKVAFDKADVVKDGGLTRLEFCELCRKELWDMPISTIQIAVDNMLTARQAIKTRLASKWQRVAQRVDVESRLLLPATYLITLVFLFNFDFQDRYATDPRIAMMAPDYMIIALGSSSTAWFILMGLAFFLILGSWCLMQRMGKAAQRKKKELERDYVATLSKKLEKTTRETRAGGDSGYKKDGGFAQPAHVLDGEAAEAARLESESAASGLAVR